MPASTRSVCAHSGSQTSARSRFWRMTTSAVTSACGEKAVLGQADRSHELGALGDPSAGGGILLVERAFGRDESHDASRPHQVERPREEPIVHEQPLVPMAGIVDLVAAEGHVSHRDVERFVVEVCVLEAAVDDLRGRMEGAGACTDCP